jgi:hypothetical protein
MGHPHGFDYNQPSCDTLAGIFVEATDSVTAADELPTRQEKRVRPAQVEQLFGHTLTVEDDNTAERPRRTAQA